MKQILAKLIIVAVLAATGFWILKTGQKEMILQEQRQDVMWEKRRQTENLVSAKIAILDKVANDLEKQAGKIDYLHVFDQEFLPSVIRYRWGKYLSGTQEDGLDGLNQAVEIAIEQILFAQELFKNDKISEVYPTFRDIARDKTSSEVRDASLAARGRRETVMIPFRKQEKEIESLTWNQISDEDKRLHKKNREELDRL